MDCKPLAEEGEAVRSGQHTLTASKEGLLPDERSVVLPGGDSQTFAMRVYRAEELTEYRRAFSRPRFVASLRRLVPALRDADVRPAGCGVRAQALGRDGRLLDDFVFVEAERMLHVLNAPSPAATASLAIGREIAARVTERLAGAA